MDVALTVIVSAVSSPPTDNNPSSEIVVDALIAPITDQVITSIRFVKAVDSYYE